ACGFAGLAAAARPRRHRARAPASHSASPQTFTTNSPLPRAHLPPLAVPHEPTSFSGKHQPVRSQPRQSTNLSENNLVDNSCHSAETSFVHSRVAYLRSHVAWLNMRA